MNTPTHGPGDGGAPTAEWRIVLLQIRLLGLISGEALLDRLGCGSALDDECAAAGEHVELTSLEMIEMLDEGRERGWLIHHDGRLPGWNLTLRGRSEGERLLAIELDGLDGRTRVRSSYEKFRAMNRTFLDICTDWQLRPSAGGHELEPNDEGLVVTNDHSDPDWDRRILDRLVVLHAEICHLLGDTSATVPRFGSYAGRFTSALERVADGERDWLTRPGINSYHTVWFELHEDLLATLGLSRSSEHDDDGSASTRNP